MMKKLLIIYSLFASLSILKAQNWSQIGNNINGETQGNQSGTSVSISADGSIIAVGAPGNDENGTDSGQVSIYKNLSGIWTQLGQAINGVAAGDNFGASVSLNSDGNIIAIGAPGNDENGDNVGQVCVYKYNSGVWSQIGTNIDGEAAYDYFGTVSINFDGSIVAIGSYHNDGNGLCAGHVRIYKNVSNTWTQIGDDIDGEAAGDQSGTSISINADGSIIAIGAPGNDENAIDSGHVRVFQNISGVWTQIGADINGETAHDYFGASVSMNTDGTILAIGAWGNGANTGLVRVYRYNLGTWSQIGTDINGETAGDRFGISVSLSADGSVVAVGAPYNDGNTTDAGHVRVFQNISGVWTQVGADIDGVSNDDYFGHAVNLNYNGTKLIVGAFGNDNNGIDAGSVSVYENNFLDVSKIDNLNILIYPNPSTEIVNISNIEGFEIRILDVAGKIVFESKSITNKTIRLQKSGVYFLYITSKTKSFLHKIIIE